MKRVLLIFLKNKLIEMLNGAGIVLAFLVLGSIASLIVLFVGIAVSNIHPIVVISDYYDC